MDTLIRQWADLIDHTVEYGAQVFQWCLQASRPLPKDTPIPLILSLRHVLEMLDAISVLTRNMCAEPIKPLLRSLLESALHIEYLVQDRNEFERRALSYIIGTKRAHNEMVKIADPKTAKGKEFRAALKRDKLAPDFELTEPPKATDLTRLVSKEHYRPIDAEWHRIRASRKGLIPWYALFDGPSNLRDLAYRVDLAAMYEIIYRYFADFAHGGQHLRNLSQTSSGKAAFLSLRHPKELQSLVLHSLTLTFHIYRTLLAFLDPEKLQPMSQWYSEIVEPYSQLAGPPIIDILDE